MNDHDPQKDFDFFIGTWNVHNRKLKERMKDCTEWQEFQATVVARHIWDGLGNTDEFFAPEAATGPVRGMTLRLYNPKSKQWSLYWANSINGTLEIPVIGGFENGRGEFYNQEMFEGRSIFVRFLWSEISQNSCRWEQAFSGDGGKTWETNWIMQFTRK